METWQEKAHKELEELRGKITNLEIFMRSEEFKLLSKPNQDLLLAQFQYMNGYATVLVARLAIN